MMIDQNNILHVLINNSGTAWPSLIPFLSFLDSLLHDVFVIYPYTVNKGQHMKDIGYHTDQGSQHLIQDNFNNVIIE